MSKLSDNIKTTITDKRVITNFADYSFTTDSYIPHYDYIVKFIAKFGVEKYVSEDLIHDTKVLDTILNDIKHKVVQEIFGEFRDPIHNIVAQLYRREYDKALDSVHKLEKQMFDV